jgi:tripartite-type tricarboxylate transporter receptor subunit TctC
MFRLSLACLLVVACHIARSEDFPSSPVRFVVPSPPGGTADLIARLLGKKLAETWHQSVVVDNRTGGTGTIGADLVAKAAPNGYTLLVTAPGPVTTNAVFLDKLPYDPIKDLAPITLLAITPSFLMVGPTVPSKTVAELVAFAKSKPGKLNYASSGVGNPSHLQGAMLGSVAGIDIVHIPYKGGALALTDLVGGHVDIMFNPIPAMLPMVKANKLRALAVTSPQRFSGLPDVPTMAESGYPQIGSTAWYGALAPAKIPRPLLKKLHADFVAALAAPEVKDALVAAGSDIIGSSPEKFGEFIRKEIADASKLIKLSGAKRTQ